MLYMIRGEQGCASWSRAGFAVHEQPLLISKHELVAIALIRLCFLSALTIELVIQPFRSLALPIGWISVWRHCACRHAPQSDAYWVLIVVL